ncbi:MAG: hypothetical protein ACYC1P_05515, partial [Gaiellaceae bacterium]
MRPGALAVVSLVAAGLGAAAVLLVGSLAGWIDGEEGVRTVVVPTIADGAANAGPTVAPLVGDDFEPARIYASRAEGVVTIYSYFADGQRSQGSGFVVSDAGHILTNSHVVTDAGEDRARARARGASRLYVAGG